MCMGSARDICAWMKNDDPDQREIALKAWSLAFEDRSQRPYTASFTPLSISSTTDIKPPDK
jgi:hypothetical protein